MIDLDEKLLRGLYEQLPLGVSVEDYSEVKLVVDRLYNEGIRDLGTYLGENPGVFSDMVLSIQALHANESLLKMIGVKSFQEYIDGDGDYQNGKVTRWKEFYLQEIVSLSNGKVHTGEIADQTVDGTPVEVRRVTRILDGHEDDWSLVIATHEDITEQKQTEETLRETLGWLDEAQRVGQVGHWVWDEIEQVEVYVSEESSRIFGSDDKRGWSTWDEFLNLVHADDRERVARDQDEAADNARSYNSEYRIVYPNGKIRFIIERGEPVFDDVGRLIRTVGTIQDITERKLAEDQLRQSQKIEAVGQLTGGVAHDFNNLLAIINGNLELAVYTGTLESGTQELLQRAMVAVDKGAALTDQLLTFSRQQTLNPKISNANALIVDMTRLLERTLGEDIEIRTTFAEDLPPINVDPGLLGNAILNMANNARDAMPGGGLLRIDTCQVEPDRKFLKEADVDACGPHVMITVSDAGSGMDEATLKHAFEPFYTTKGVGEGTGLGLAMVYGFVKQSGGYIKIESEIGKGTSIKLYFPIAEGRLEDTEDTTTKLENEMRGKETILVVEDDEDLREVTAAMLNHLGYTVLEAEDGPSALKLLGENSESVDLVFSDVIMPSGMSGYDLANELKRQYQYIKVLITSGYPEKDIKKEGIDGAGITLLRKPYKKAQLAEAVRTTLEQ